MNVSDPGRLSYTIDKGRWEASHYVGTLRAPDNHRVGRYMEPGNIEKLIAEGLPGATVRVASDDNHHFEALVVAEEFDGLRTLARHRLVYKCLGSMVGNEIHALSLRTMTPVEWEAAGGSR